MEDPKHNGITTIQRVLDEAKNNEWNIVQYFLLSTNPSINHQNDRDNGNTLLHYAVLHRNKKMIASLLSKGADPLLENNYGTNSFAYASQYKIRNTFDELYVKSMFMKEFFTEQFNDSHKGAFSHQDGKNEGKTAETESHKRKRETSAPSEELQRDKGKEKADDLYDEEENGRQERRLIIRNIFAKPHAERNIDEQKLLKKFLKTPKEIEETLNEYRERIKLILGNDVPIDSLTYLFGHLENVKLSQAISKPQNNYISEYLPFWINT